MIGQIALTWMIVQLTLFVMAVALLVAERRESAGRLAGWIGRAMWLWPMLALWAVWR